jgi:Fe(3+) dicitrate transport protein
MPGWRVKSFNSSMLATVLLQRLWAVGLVLTTAILPFSSAIAQSPIRGVVRDASSGRPVEAARVELIGRGISTQTDAAGRFSLRGVFTAGSATISVTRIGYAPNRHEISVANATSELVVQLTPVPTAVAGVVVLGERASDFARLPGSEGLVSHDDIRKARPLSGNEMLRAVAGVYVQDEEGIGLRANIGIRGLDPDRSRTVLILEDGVPVSLNPYGEPELYYTPPIDRMQRIEVLKGSGSILHGPQTIGGVINFVTADPPLVPEVGASLFGGGGGFLKASVHAGGTWETAGLRVASVHRRADDFRGLRFSQTDILLKTTMSLGALDVVGLKVGAYVEESNATYVGLTDSLYRANPLAYPSADDLLSVKRLTGALSHERQVGDATRVRTVVYAYTTTRDWSRQDYAYSSTGASIIPANSTGNRDRSFEVAGVESRLRGPTALGHLEAGVRVHGEWARDQMINGATATARSGAIRDDEKRRGRALAAFAQHQFVFGPRVQITPGVRAEYFAFERKVLRARVRRETSSGTTRLPEDVDVRTSDDIMAIVPGVGVSYYAASRATLFAGVHRGFAPPRTKDAFVLTDPVLAPGQQVPEPVSLQLDAETSWNGEVGARTRPFGNVAFDVTAFVLDFSNQIITPSASAGSVAQARLANQGATRHAGFEAALEVDWRALGGARIPLRTLVQYTFVDARFSKDRFIVSGADTINVNGNELPYAPRHRVNVGVSLDGVGGFDVRLDGTMLSELFADNFETREGSANGRNGVIPGYHLWNASASYALPSGASVVAAVKNIFDARYIASRRPEGIKPGLPRLVQVGVELRR